jgi:hypothetical protein
MKRCKIKECLVMTCRLLSQLKCLKPHCLQVQVLGSRKPNCVIIDEIDGATGGSDGGSAIAALLTIINATGNKQAAASGNTVQGIIFSAFEYCVQS